LDATALTSLVVTAFGAAAIGAFTNLPLTYLGVWPSGSARHCSRNTSSVQQDGRRPFGKFAVSGALHCSTGCAEIASAEYHDASATNQSQYLASAMDVQVAASSAF